MMGGNASSGYLRSASAGSNNGSGSGQFTSSEFSTMPRISTAPPGGDIAHLRIAAPHQQVVEIGIGSGRHREVHFAALSEPALRCEMSRALAYAGRVMIYTDEHLARFRW